jgi:hypothetical protein
MVRGSTRAKVKRGSIQARTAAAPAATKLIDPRIGEQLVWQKRTLTKVRRLIKEADPEIVEEVKWRKPSNPSGVPVWYHDGGICTGETYKDHVKLTFFKGASLEDPCHLFTQPGAVRRAIDFYEGSEIDESAFKDLIRAAVTFNTFRKKKPWSSRD